MTAPRWRAAGAADGDVVPVVTFTVGGREFAADVFQVQQVLRYERPAPAPDAPRSQEGTIEVRGRTVPVLDLRRRFSLPAAPVTDATRIVLVEDGRGGSVGLVVDAASEVLRVSAAAVAAPTAAVHGLAADYVQGVIRLGERSLVLLRTARLLQSADRIVLELTDEESHG